MYRLILFIILGLTLGSYAATCVKKNNPAVTPLTSPLETTDVITFDNIGLDPNMEELWNDGSTSSPLSVSEKPGQRIVLTGQQKDPASVMIAYNTPQGASLVYWDGSAPWNNNASNPNPGLFLYVQQTGVATLQFNPPITAFVARSTCDIGMQYQAWIEIYDNSSNALDCRFLPCMPGGNNYFNAGFYSTIPIGYIRYYGASGVRVFADNIQYVTCGSGYSFNKTKCLDVDECQNNPCPSYLTCFNSPGSYSCACNAGYEDVNQECVDIDECLTNACGAHFNCLNTNGSYSCNCQDGYEYNNDTLTCDDIDECTTLSPCSTLANCTNTDGSFMCTCNEGYEGTGQGQDGCQVVQPPTNSNSPSSTTSPTSSSPLSIAPSTTGPSSNEPLTAPSSNAPSTDEPYNAPAAAGRTPSRRAVSSASTGSVLKLVVLLALLLIVV